MIGELRRRRQGGRVFLGLLFVLVLLLLLALSWWQWTRGADKQAGLALQAQRGQLPVIQWQGEPAFPEAWLQRQVVMTGELLPTYRVALDNQMRGRQAGYELHLAFRPSGWTTLVLVNVGWLPTDRDGGPPPPETFASLATVQGRLVRPSPFVTVGAPELTRGLWRAGRIVPSDWAARWQQPVAPYVLQLDAAIPGFYLRDWAPSAQQRLSPDRHRAYAFQWFMLALAWCACWFFAARRGRT